MLRGSKLGDVGQDPDYRFSLANERTFLAWIRTSLALVAGGVAALTLLPEDFGPTWSRDVVGAVLLCLAAAVAVVSLRRWEATERALRTQQPLPPPSLLRVVAAGVAGCALLILLLAVLGG